MTVLANKAALAATVSNSAPVAPNGNIPAAKVKATGKARGGNVKPGKAKVAETKTKPETWQTRGNAIMKETAKVFVLGDFKAISNAEADKAIGQIRKSGQALRTMAHKTACGIMLHYVEHGDYTKIDGLLSAVMVGMSKRMANGLIDWVKAFSSLQYDEKTMAFSHVKGTKRFFHLTGDPTAKDGTWHNKGALNHAFWSGSFGDDDAKPFAFDAEKYLEEALQRIVKKFDTMLAKKLDEKTPAKVAKKIKIERDHIKAIEAFAKSQHVKLTHEAPTVTQ